MSQKSVCDHAHETNSCNPDSHHCCSSLIVELIDYLILTKREATGPTRPACFRVVQCPYLCTLPHRMYTDILF